MRLVDATVGAEVTFYMPEAKIKAMGRIGVVMPVDDMLHAKVQTEQFGEVLVELRKLRPAPKF